MKTSQVFVIKPTNTIKLNCKEIEVSLTRISGNNDIPGISTVSRDEEHQMLSIIFRDHLNKGQILDLLFTFGGTLKDTNSQSGYLRREYQEEGITKHLTITHFIPTSARKVFPCFDEPGMKATFRIRVGHQEKYNAVSNMPILKDKEVM